MSRPTTRRRNRDSMTRSLDAGKRAGGLSRRQMLTPLRRETNPYQYRIGSRRGRRVRAAIIVAGLLGNLGAFGDLIDGGVVDMSCEDCYCEGDSDYGKITVFDMPASEERVASVDGQYVQVLDTSCDTDVISVEDTVYELSGVDLESRIMGVAEVSSVDCADTKVASSSSSDGDCYSGATDISDDVEMTLTFEVLSFFSDDAAVKYRTNVIVKVTGDEDPDVDKVNVCLDEGFVSQLFRVSTQGTYYLFNYELIIPGEDTSSDLSVSSSPSSADDFACGTEPTPSPVNPPTPSPVEPPTPSPVQPPTPSPIEPDPTPAPIEEKITAEPTPGPTPELTDEPTPETSEATPKPTPGPTAQTTSLPVANPTPQPSTGLDGPVVALAATPVPAPASTEAPFASATKAPSSPFVVTTTPVPSDIVEPMPSSKPSAAPTLTAETRRPSDTAELYLSPTPKTSTSQPSSTDATGAGSISDLMFDEKTSRLRGSVTVGAVGVALLVGLTFLPIFK